MCALASSLLHVHVRDLSVCLNVCIYLFGHTASCGMCYACHGRMEDQDRLRDDQKSKVKSLQHNNIMWMHNNAQVYIVRVSCPDVPHEQPVYLHNIHNIVHVHVGTF